MVQTLGISGQKICSKLVVYTEACIIRLVNFQPSFSMDHPIPLFLFTYALTVDMICFKELENML